MLILPEAECIIIIYCRTHINFSLKSCTAGQLSPALAYPDPQGWEHGKTVPELVWYWPPSDTDCQRLPFFTLFYQRLPFSKLLRQRLPFFNLLHQHPPYFNLLHQRPPFFNLLRQRPPASR